jgi:mRNA interferase YafQ
VKFLYSEKFNRKINVIAKSNRDLAKEVFELIELLNDDPYNPGLRLHKLRNDFEEYWSISAGDNLRIVFYYIEDTIVLFDIGGHEEVYEEN